MKWPIVTALCASLLLAVALFAMADAPRSDIIFPHEFHVDEAEVACVTCHGNAETSTRSGDRLYPTMDVCADCHEVEDEGNCRQCHRHPEEPEASPHADRDFFFGHATHLQRGAECQTCHGEPAEIRIPDMPLCLTCHNGRKADDDCAVCHGDAMTLADIHPADWRHRHGDRATTDAAWCVQCHSSESFCLDCHRGDNVTGAIHDLNFIWTHGLEANSKSSDCTTCHDRRLFCADCHERENRIPLLHSSLAWLPNHGDAARADIENCASCHDEADPTCARAGCHGDADGLRGTDPRFHSSSLGLFDGQGPWHDDEGYFCFQCHTSTRAAGTGFCGYCHGAED